MGLLIDKDIVPVPMLRTAENNALAAFLSHLNIAQLTAYTARCVQKLNGSMKNGPLQSPGMGLGAGFEEGAYCWGKCD